MKFSYKFSNLCGSVYSGGNLVFTPDGNSVLSPVGNRITVFDLRNHKATTLPFENRKNIARLALSPDGHTLISVDIDGHALLINFFKRVVLAHFNFKKRVLALEFSPDSKYFAVSHGNLVQIWRAPSLITQFAPFSLYRTFSGHTDDVISLCWSSCSQFFVSGSKDTTLRVRSLHKRPMFVPIQLSGHRGYVVGCFFGQGNYFYSVGKDGALFTWRIERQEQNGDIGMATENDDPLLASCQFELANKNYFSMNHAKVLCVSLHRTFSQSLSLLVVGFSSGIFALYELPDFTQIHSLSISQHDIKTVTVNSSGEWLAFGSAKLGQLLVWEWQSETYVLKQQGHFFDVNTLAYSPDGQLVVTGGGDGKVKLWNTSSGFCFVTFADHASAVSEVVFSQTGNVVLSASLDGTVRAYDLVRYKNFRTLSAPNAVQFSCLTLDNSGEVVIAGSSDPFEIYVWSLQTGRLLDVFTGHEGPISSLSFNSKRSLLASGSWDGSVKLWTVFEGKSAVETFRQTSSDVLAVAFRPDGKEVCSATLDGQLVFWNVDAGSIRCTIEGSKDILGGRRSDDRRAAKNSTIGRCFTSVCYTADGTCVLAGGNSKYVCIYEVSQKILIKKFQLSNNRSFDGVLNFLNSKNMTVAGPVDSDDDLTSSDEEGPDVSLPGVKEGDLSSRKTKLAIRSKCVRFSPTGRAWACASTEGLLMYSLDQEMTFDPVEMDMEVTPKAIRKCMAEKDFSKALVMSLRLNETKLIRLAVESTPLSEVELVIRSLPEHFVQKTLNLLASFMDSTAHIQFYLRWLTLVLRVHGPYVQKHSNTFATTLRFVHKNVNRHYKEIAKLCTANQFQLDFLSECGSGEKIELQKETEETQSLERKPFDVVR
eukprot:243227_1